MAVGNVFFTSPEHKAGFLTAMQGLRKVYDGRLDPEYGAAIYILTADAATWDKASDYVSRDGIDFEALLREAHFSSGYGALIRLAGNLFNDRTTCSPVDLMLLDDTNFLVALTALQVRHRALSVSEAEIYNAEMDTRLHRQLEAREKPWLPPSGEEL